MNLPRVFLTGLVFFGLFVSQIQVPAAIAQVRPRVVDAVDDAKRMTLSGNVHPLARAEFDRGTVADSQPMNRILLLLKRSDEQESALQTYLEQQQSKSSTNYHAWLTPEQFGAQFGPADADIQAVSDWLTQQGFTIGKVYSGKTVIEFSGTVGQVQRAFGTAIHSYQVEGKLYSANASDPQIPAALAPVVAGVVSLHNFPLKFFTRRVGVFQKKGSAGRSAPLYSSPGGFYPLAPADFATIYNAKGLYGTGTNGSGQTIAIVGETNINVSDVQNFRQLFNLPANFTSANVVLNGEDPGITSKDEETEADLDVQWSGAVAPGATIKFVVSASTATTQGIDLSALYIIEHNLAGVLSESYGGCEQSIGSAANSFYNALWKQAAAQGITAILSAGDGGSAGCDNFNTETVATHGLAVSGLASTSFNVSVGGTDFDQIGRWTQFWSQTNDPTTSESALGYIPETAWNDSCAAQGVSGCASSSNLNIVGGSGGPSTIYAKPSWQMGVAGMPNDNHRDQPDVSLFASNGFAESAYIVCQADITTPAETSCNLNVENFTYVAVGGTSASAPSFAGIMALVNQKTAARQGVANPAVYALANKAGAVCDSGTAAASGNTCVFYDVTKGNNSVPCPTNSLDCSSKLSTSDGILVDSKGNPAWQATPGFDMATGLGTINIANLVNNWGSVSSVATLTALSLTPTTGITHGTSENMTVNVTVKPTSGTGIPNGEVSLIATLQSGATLGMDNFALVNGAVTGQKSQNLPGGTYHVHAHYAGDGINAPSDSAEVSVTVAPEGSKTFLIVPVYDPMTGKLQSGNASNVAYGAPYRIRMYVTNSASAPGASGPPTPTCDAVNIYTCPTGIITLTANGQAVDRVNGIYQLNDIGYTRDIQPTLSAGTYSLTAQYNGDSSYQPSSTTDSLTITLAQTRTDVPSVDNTSIATVGVPYGLNVNVFSNSFGALETGTITVYDGGTPVSGKTVIWNGQDGTYSQGHAFIQTTTTFTFTTPGTHVLTAKYSGDANYAASTSSSSYSVSVYSPTTVSLSASSLNIIAGNTITVTAIVDTTAKSPYPTQNLQFYGTGDGYFPGMITYKQITDSSGNAALQGTLVVTPLYTEQIWANFNGDTNFAASSSYMTPLNLTVVTPDFSVGPAQFSLMVPTGQSGGTSLSVTPMTNLSSQVSFDIQGTNYTPGITCTVTPNPVSLSNQQTATAMFGCSVPAPSNVTSVSVVPGLKRPSTNVRNRWWMVSAVAAIFALLTLLLASTRQVRRMAGAGFAISLLSFAIGCGGSGSSGAGGGGGGGGGGGATPSSVTLSVANTKVPNTTSIAATVVVSGTQTPTGTVILYDGQFAVGGPVPLVNGKAQINFTAAPTVGSHVLTATYSGDTKNLASKTNSSLVVVTTGTATLFLNARTGTDLKQIIVSLNVQ